MLKIRKKGIPCSSNSLRTRASRFSAFVMLRDLINPHLAAAFSVSEDSPPDPKSTEI